MGKLATKYKRPYPEIGVLLFLVLALVVWVRRRSNTDVVWRAPSLSSTPNGAPLSPCACGLRIEALPPPTMLEGTWLLPRIKPATCDGYFSYATEQYRTAYWQQHRLMHYVKESLTAADSHAGASPCAARSHFTIALVDDEVVHDCWYFAVHNFPVPELSAAPTFPGILNKRDAAVDWVLARRNPQELVVVLEDHPYYNLNPLKQLDERIFRVVLEVSQVPKAHRSSRRFLVAPYVAAANPFLRAPLHAAASDSSLLFFHGTCRNGDSDSSGMRLRHHVIAALKAAPSLPDALPTSVACACAICPAAAGHDALLRDLAHARFCLIIPGDTASSRRLSEVMAAGCVPVFVGPPWHALPLSPFIDYFSFALFFHLVEQPWLRGDTGIFEPDPWTAQTLLSGKGVSRVSGVPELLRRLQGMDNAEVARRRRGVAKFAPYFVFLEPGANSSASAGSLLMSAVCAYINGG
jgi:hypothetical protein